MMDLGEQHHHQYGLPYLRHPLQQEDHHHHLFTNHGSSSSSIITPTTESDHQQHLHLQNYGFGMLLFGDGAAAFPHDHPNYHHHHQNLAAAGDLQLLLPSPNPLLQMERHHRRQPLVLLDQQQQQPTPPAQQQQSSGSRGQRMGGNDSFDAHFEDGGTGYCQGRWPRQETLTLLEIRTRLDPKFREAAHKAPLWDEVSRIMAEEHGYQRTGKKCREKLENLYKYYKKTREGRAGRHDGKHYRFFRQLEALYGESSSNHNAGNRDTSMIMATTSNSSAFHLKMITADHPAASISAQIGLDNCEHVSFSNSSEFCTTSSSEENLADGGVDGDLRAVTSSGNVARGKRKHERRCLKRGRKSWKSKIKDFVDVQLKRFMEVQEAWLDRMLRTLESKEQERVSREEEWRKKEATRSDREQKRWAHERAWVEARDAALIDALEKLGKRQPLIDSTPEEAISMESSGEPLSTDIGNTRWSPAETTTLIKLRTEILMGPTFGDIAGCSKRGDRLWEEISAQMTAAGYERSAKRCKEKWDGINKNFLEKAKECSKRRKESSRAHCQPWSGNEEDDAAGEQALSPSGSIVGAMANDDGCYNLVMEAETVEESNRGELQRGQHGLW